MSDLSAQTIRRLSLVSPFHERAVQAGMSYGLSSASYDVRSAVDCILWPKCSRLIWTLEHINLPPHINGKVYNKSTWARRFVDLAKTTYIDPGFRGALQLEVTNHCWFKPYRLRKGDPVAQIIFTFLDEPTEQPYCGKYQDQAATIVGPRMEHDPDQELPWHRDGHS
jgi:dCTP deaminase